MTAKKITPGLYLLLVLFTLLIIGDAILLLSHIIFGNVLTYAFFHDLFVLIMLVWITTDLSNRKRRGLTIGILTFSLIWLSTLARFLIDILNKGIDYSLVSYYAGALIINLLIVIYLYRRRGYFID